MIFISGNPFQFSESSSTSEESTPGILHLFEGIKTRLRGKPDSHILNKLMDDRALVSSTNSFKALGERKFSASENSDLERSTSKLVYVFQREYATVDPALVDFIGTDEATTCIGIAIRYPKTGLISVAHMDFPDNVDKGLSQMLSSLIDLNSDAELDVHLVGGFEDVSPKQNKGSTRSARREKLDGYSFPLCIKIIKSLCARQEKFHLQTFCVLQHNTKRDSEGNPFPIFHGFAVKTADGSILPASFDETTRCPDEVVRRIRLSAASEDEKWDGRLLDTYETGTDQFCIRPFSWTLSESQIALSLQNLSDSEILQICSTSPSAEGPDFVESLKRKWSYLIEHPDWKETFPEEKPRIFKRSADGSWERCIEQSSGVPNYL